MEKASALARRARARAPRRAQHAVALARAVFGRRARFLSRARRAAPCRAVRTLLASLLKSAAARGGEETVTTESGSRGRSLWRGRGRGQVGGGLFGGRRRRRPGRGRIGRDPRAAYRAQAAIGRRRLPHPPHVARAPAGDERRLSAPVRRRRRRRRAPPFARGRRRGGGGGGGGRGCAQHAARAAAAARGRALLAPPPLYFSLSLSLFFSARVGQAAPHAAHRSARTLGSAARRCALALCDVGLPNPPRCLRRARQRPARTTTWRASSSTTRRTTTRASPTTTTTTSCRARWANTGIESGGVFVPLHSSGAVRSHWDGRLGSPGGRRPPAD